LPLLARLPATRVAACPHLPHSGKTHASRAMKAGPSVGTLLRGKHDGQQAVWHGNGTVGLALS